MQSVQSIYLAFWDQWQYSISIDFGTLFVSLFDFFNFSNLHHFDKISCLYS